MLATVDAAHEGLSGPAVRRILEREYQLFANSAYVRLAHISVSHIYNLRRSRAYRKHRVVLDRTQTRQVGIAERSKPDSQGQPGYLRVDTVHQGHWDSRPGLYHINAVDTVTQWQVVGSVETISERHLVPVLEAMLHQFPFRLRGFHCDNGSEFLNHRVARLLNKLLIEFTKSRPYRTTDNALVEGKNGAVVRKHIGYGAIGRRACHRLAEVLHAAYFNSYLNYHRPCGFATIEITARGRRRRRYRADDYRTPYEKLLSLPDWQKHLKDGVRPETLQQQASRHSDTAAAQRMQKAKLALLSPLSNSSLIPPDFCSDGSGARGLQTPAPLPRTPIPRCLTATERRTPAAPPFPILLLQAHSWIGKCCMELVRPTLVRFWDGPLFQHLAARTTSTAGAGPTIRLAHGSSGNLRPAGPPPPRFHHHGDGRGLARPATEVYLVNDNILYHALYTPPLAAPGQAIMPDRSLTCSRAGAPPMPAQPAWFHRLDEILVLPRGIGHR